MSKFISVFLCVIATLNLHAQSTKEPVKVTDLLKIKTVGGVSLSKDARNLLFTVTNIEADGENKWEYKYNTQLWMAAADGSSEPKQLTAKDNSSQAVFSPDGSQIVFVRAVEGKSQLFLLSMSGGEAIQLTKFKYGASSPKWSPDGKQLLFSASIPMKDLLRDSLVNPKHFIPTWSFEKPGINNNIQFNNRTSRPDPDGSIEEVRSYLENNVTDKKAKVVDKLNFQDETDVNADMSFNQLFIINVAAPTRPLQLTNGFYRYGNADFVPSGKEIIFVASIDSTQHPDRVLESAIYTMNTDGSNLQRVVGSKNKSYTSPSVSPSGKWIAFQYDTTSFVSIPTLAIISRGTKSEITTFPFDRNKSNLTWSSDERYIYFSAQSNGGAPVYRIDINSKKSEQLTRPDAGVIAFDLVNDRLAYATTSINDPSALYVSNAAGKNEKKIGNFNSWVASRNISLPEKKTFLNSMGVEVEYWIMKPANYQAGQKYPLLLEIHGGPSSMWGPGEPSMWHEFQYFCSKGYGVVYCNPRGSGGYGLNFLKGNVNDWGTGPTSDVLTALDKTVALGWADTSKLLITGGSYAGYLVAWIIAHDQRFKAACSQRGVYDLATFFGEGNAWRLVPNYFGGYPWEPAVKKVLERESPITYVENIRTPYIIFHGDNDRRTGFVQSEMLYRSLKALGRPVEYVRHPGGTHELTRSGNNRQRIDQMLRTWEFFERWIH
jgi:dipeptidyl aminopeptidase/acylaminoacyl peptidase